MANIKTSKELTSELGKQKRLLDSIDESNRRYEATQRRIVTLQNQIAKARAKENEETRKSQPLYKELESSSSSLIISVLLLFINCWIFLAKSYRVILSSPHI